MNITEDTNVEIFVCFHDLKQLPNIKKIIKGNNIYKPLLLGENCGEDSPDYYCENKGDNISYLNPFFSEMSGIYWMCKNSNADIIGLAHYRRYFVKSKYFGELIDEDFILENLKDNDMLIQNGTKPLRKTNYDSYGGKLLDETLVLLKKYHPEYVDAYNKVINSNYPLSFFNMFVSDKKIIEEYCEWFIPILKELSKNLDESENPRIVGVMGEFLFNIYICHNKLNFKWTNVRVTEPSKLKLRMFFSKMGFVRSFFKHIYYPIKDKL